MATVKKTTAVKSNAATAQSPTPGATAGADQTPQPISASSVYLRLVNGCSTYVTPQREVFYSKEQDGRARIYEVPRSELSRLLSYKDDYSRKFFQQVHAPDDGAVSKPDDLAKSKIEEAPKLVEDEGGFRAAGGALRADEDDGGLIDTGVTRLKDKDGDPVGVTV